MMENSETTRLVSADMTEGSRVSFSSDDEVGKVTISGNRPSSSRTPWFVWTLAFFAAIGGFLFGYDTGVVSGAMLLLRDRFHLSSVWQEVIVSVTIGAACLSALLGGFMNDKFGRKGVTIFASVVFTVGAVVLGAAQDVAMLVAGRIIVGIGIGLASMTVPIYIAECAPVHIRGRMVTLNVLFITGGQFVASALDGGFSYLKVDGWRYMLGLAGVPSVIQLFGFIFLPESPRWLMKKGHDEQARKVLMRMRGTEDVEQEMKDMQAVVEEEERIELSEEGQGMTIIRAFRTPHVRRAIFVGCGLQFFQQLSGINTVMYYSATIIKMAGVSNQHLAIWLAAVTAFVNFIFTLVGVWLVERIGRKKLIIGSLAGVTLSLVVLAVAFQLAAFNSPAITRHTPLGANSTCDTYSFCEDCIENTACGFCYREDASGQVNGTCLETLAEDNVHALYGQCSNTTLPTGVIWAYEYCPTSYSWLAILGLVMYLMFFAPGMGPMPWTINSEIYPLWARSTGNSLATAVNWISNLVVAMTFLTLTETLTRYGTYWLFVGITMVGIFFFVMFVPETKGKKLEEVEELFKHPWCTCGENKPYAEELSVNHNSRPNSDTTVERTK